MTSGKRLRWGLMTIASLIALCSYAQNMTINGYVRDVGAQEALVGAYVYVADGTAGTSTNQFGYYSLTLPSADSVVLLISYVGYKAQAKLFLRGENTRMDVFLLPGDPLEEIEVQATRADDNVTRTQMGVIDIPVRELADLPVLAGERDLLKTIQLLPGVQPAQEGTTGFYVRGGNLDQNLVQLDGATVYNPNHLFGLVSTFNINSINNVALLKGGFPARYGGRLSSVLDITMKDGSRDRYETAGGIGLLSSNMTIQGPFLQKRGSFIASARRSYVDLIQKAFVPGNTTLYSFYDVNAKVNLDIGPDDRIYLSGFTGRDNGSYTGPNSLNYGIGFGNRTATARWNHLFNGRLFSNASLIFNSYDLGLSTEQGTYYSLFYTGITDVSAKGDFTWMRGPANVVTFGMHYHYHTLYPATYSDQIPKSGRRVTLEPRYIPRTFANEMAVYINHEWDPTPAFGLNYGLRMPYYIARSKSYSFPEPRITARIAMPLDASFKVSYTVMHQFLHAVPYSTASLPMEIWIASSPNVKPQRSAQYSAGLFRNFFHNVFEVSLEGYFKEMTNQVLFKQGTQLEIGSDIEQHVTFGKGVSYGAELLVRKYTGRLTGWIGYTWAKTTQTFEELNFGEPFPFTYDRRHSASVAGTYRINDRWLFAADFVFRTGSAFTLPPGRIPVVDGTLYDGWYYDFTTRNNARQRAYHRLDISFSYRKPRRIFRRDYESEWVFGVYNLYSRQNPYFVYLTVDPQSKLPLARQVSLLPAIPSVSYNFKF